jgi:enamine deaminase RidA (YjgF/YER057c/UK114 family)
MKTSDVVVPRGMEMAYDRFHFAPAVRAGGLLRGSGQLGTDERFVVAAAEPEAQFVRAFENVKSVLAAAELDFSDVVEMTTFHVGLREHLGTFLAVKDRYFSAPWPAWTAIGVVELAAPGALVEIRVTARLREARAAKTRVTKTRSAAKARSAKRPRKATSARKRRGGR